MAILVGYLRGQFLQIYFAWSKFIHDFTEYQPVSHILNEIIYVHIFNVQGIHPHSEDSLFSRSLRIIVVIDDTCCGHFLFFRWCESRAVVEEMRQENEIEFGMSIDNIGWLNARRHSNCFSIVDNLFAALQLI